MQHGSCSSVEFSAFALHQEGSTVLSDCAFSSPCRNAVKMLGK